MVRSPSAQRLACAFLIILLSTLACATAPQTAPAAGPLRVHPTNPRYFTDGSGKAVTLTGSHTWGNLVDYTSGWPPFDFTAYLDFLQRFNHNYSRGWIGYATGNTPSPWPRTGPGNALDGGLKFDFSRFNQAFFDRLRSRAVAARDRGIYLSVMFFRPDDAKQVDWSAQPFHKDNNVQALNGDPNGDGNGWETYALQVPAITAVQEAYVRKAIDTLNDLDNVFWEIGNEGDWSSVTWQYHFINLIKNYESGKPKRHPVGMTAVFNIANGSWASDNAPLWNSPADWISPGISPYQDNPPAADGRKVIIADVDHIWPTAPHRGWIWECFLRGIQPILMDYYTYGSPQWTSTAEQEAMRKNMGYTLTYARKMNLAAMTPQNALSSTAYCLANTGSEYLVYQPASGQAFTVNLAAGSYTYEWFDSGTGSVASTGSFTAAAGARSFTAPFAGDAVLYLKGTPAPPPSNQPPTVRITSPTSGATFTAPASIAITGDASDPDGSVVRVEFYEGTHRLGEDTSSPYGWTWNNVAAGTYTLTAKATDNAQATTTSPPVTITVNPTTPPPPPPPGPQEVAGFTLIDADLDQPITGYDPLPGGATLNLATLPTRNLNIRANTVPATVGSVRFELDGNTTYRVENADPYALEGDSAGDYAAWTPGVGSHSLRATPYTQTDGTGTAGTASVITFTVIDDPGAAPPPPAPSPASTSRRQGENANGDAWINDRCAGGSIPPASPAGLGAFLLGGLAWVAVRRR